MARYPKPKTKDFVDSKFMTADEKRLMVQAVVNFLKSDLDPKKLTKRVYEFFHIKLSMRAEYNIDGFKYRHLKDEESKHRFLAEVRDRVESYANLDPDRGSDMADKFSPYHRGWYAQLLQYEHENYYYFM